MSLPAATPVGAGRSCWADAMSSSLPRDLPLAPSLLAKGVCVTEDAERLCGVTS